MCQVFHSITMIRMWHTCGGVGVTVQSAAPQGSVYLPRLPPTVRSGKWLSISHTNCSSWLNQATHNLAFRFCSSTPRSHLVPQRSPGQGCDRGLQRSAAAQTIPAIDASLGGQGKSPPRLRIHRRPAVIGGGGGTAGPVMEGGAPLPSRGPQTASEYIMQN